ncbi:Death on curing protein, Doc toxin [uncultured Synechococcales cyanobacterium]|uniref:Death on curing protein, Doc toxin n=1 Tax=uncultured Synechococcales cyanobacterium TaxID=1936017 RepID=A0A6J4UYD6_9CYAN|nr:Death on curing protein, Doc toxin [uncultured Synechococcales cyanobacterium]
MTGFVLDCSVAMSWCFEDEASAYADLVLDALKGTQAVVPSLWPLEVANVLSVAERRSCLSASQLTRAITLLQALPIRVDTLTAQQALGATLSLAREHSLSAYDAAYLEVAMREGLPLATADVQLLKVIKACGIPVYLQE